MPNRPTRFVVKLSTEDLQRSEARHVWTSTTGVLAACHHSNRFVGGEPVCLLACMYSVLLFWFVAIPLPPVLCFLPGILCLVLCCAIFFSSIG